MHPAKPVWPSEAVAILLASVDRNIEQSRSWTEGLSTTLLRQEYKRSETQVNTMITKLNKGYGWNGKAKRDLDLTGEELGLDTKGSGCLELDQKQKAAIAKAREDIDGDEFGKGNGEEDENHDEEAFAAPSMAKAKRKRLSVIKEENQEDRPSPRKTLKRTIASSPAEKLTRSTRAMAQHLPAQTPEQQQTGGDPKQPRKASQPQNSDNDNASTMDDIEFIDSFYQEMRDRMLARSRIDVATKNLRSERETALETQVADLQKQLKVTNELLQVANARITGLEKQQLGEPSRSPWQKLMLIPEHDSTLSSIPSNLSSGELFSPECQSSCAPTPSSIRTIKELPALTRLKQGAEKDVEKDKKKHISADSDLMYHSPGGTLEADYNESTALFSSSPIGQSTPLNTPAPNKEVPASAAVQLSPSHRKSVTFRRNSDLVSEHDAPETPGSSEFDRTRSLLAPSPNSEDFRQQEDDLAVQNEKMSDAVEYGEESNQVVHDRSEWWEDSSHVLDKKPTGVIPGPALYDDGEYVDDEEL